MDQMELQVHVLVILKIVLEILVFFLFRMIKYLIYQYVLNVAILLEQDKQYDEERYLDRIQMKHPKTKTGLVIFFLIKKKYNLTQVGIHFACSLPKPFRA
jgi:hypothetical protein